MLSITAASAAVMLSPLPFAEAVAGGRIGRINGQFILNPTVKEMAESDLNIVFAASADALGETGKGTANYFIVIGIIETVALFTLVFSLLLLQ